MTIAFTPPYEGTPVTAGFLIEASRCWTDSRATEEPTQPALFSLLSGHGQGVLAPVLDSLFRLYEAGLGRRFDHGEAAAVSPDERLLLDLLDGAMKRRECLDCATGVGTALDCALCSTRIMLALAEARPASLYPTT